MTIVKDIPWRKIDKAESLAIGQVLERAIKEGLIKEKDRADLGMDIGAAHLDCPINFGKLLKVRPFDFIHDVGGIQKNINRATGRLDNNFVPRCASGEKARW